MAASGLWITTTLGSPYPVIGASGSISGVLGAYFVIYLRRRIRALIGLGSFWRVVWIPVYAMIGLWFAYQFMLALTPMDTGVAYWVHVGGFSVSIILSNIIRPKLMVSTVNLRLDDYR